MVRRHLKLWMLLLIAASAPLAQQTAREARKHAAPKDCGSVVIVKCDRPTLEPADGASELARRTELRRLASGVQQLEGVVIEDEAIRRKSIAESMGSAFPVFRSRDGTHTFEVGDGSKCTCANVCLPPPLPCCQCTPNLSRYRQTPGSSPLN